MKVIYEPKGRAREYSPLAVNLYTGCTHGCKYCYVPSCTFKKREEFISKVNERKNLIKHLEEDLSELSTKQSKEKVLLSFITDVYQDIPKEIDITRKALKLFKKYNIPFTVLTKGGLKAVRDFDLYSKKDEFATTLTYFDEKKSIEIEPNASTPNERIDSLIRAHNKGIRTWVSFEPVLEEEETYTLLDKTYKFVDFYKVGKCSGYKSDVKDWKVFTNEIIRRLKFYGKDFIIKDDLKKYIE